MFQLVRSFSSGQAREARPTPSSLAGEGWGEGSLDAGRKHPILTGVRTDEFDAGGSLYAPSPLAERTTALMMGTVEGHEPEPVETGAGQS